MVAVDALNKPVIADEHERPALAALDALLANQRRGIKLVDSHGEQIELPASAHELFRQVVSGLAQARPMAVVELRRRLTVRQAALVLDEPPGRVARLLDQGTLPFAWNGKRRRIALEDVLTYKRQRDARRREGLVEIVRLSEEMGLYELEAAGKLDWREEPDD